MYISRLCLLYAIFFIYHNHICIAAILNTDISTNIQCSNYIFHSYIDCILQNIEPDTVILQYKTNIDIDNNQSWMNTTTIASVSSVYTNTDTEDVFYNVIFNININTINTINTNNLIQWRIVSSQSTSQLFFYTINNINCLSPILTVNHNQLLLLTLTWPDADYNLDYISWNIYIYDTFAHSVQRPNKIIYQWTIDSPQSRNIVIINTSPFNCPILSFHIENNNNNHQPLQPTDVISNQLLHQWFDNGWLLNCTYQNSIPYTPSQPPSQLVITTTTDVQSAAIQIVITVLCILFVCLLLVYSNLHVYKSTRLHLCIFLIFILGQTSQTSQTSQSLHLYLFIASLITFILVMLLILFYSIFCRSHMTRLYTYEMTSMIQAIIFVHLSFILLSSKLLHE
jgi:hypothetical protein